MKLFKWLKSSKPKHYTMFCDGKWAYCGEYLYEVVGSPPVFEKRAKINDDIIKCFNDMAKDKIKLLTEIIDLRMQINRPKKDTHIGKTLC